VFSFMYATDSASSTFEFFYNDSVLNINVHSVRIGNNTFGEERGFLRVRRRIVQMPSELFDCLFT